MTGSTEPDPHEWNEWQGGDVRPRRGLRALFTPSDEGFDAVEELIGARGRELEERIAALHSAIHDLDDRESRVQRLQGSIETLLRDGSAELDERHAELAREAQELQARAETLAQAEAELEERRSELGAVELRRAATENREVALDRRQEELERLAAELRERTSALETRVADAAAPGVRARRTDEHVLVEPRDGYRVLVRSGPAPEVGALVELDAVTYVVARVGRSPLPGDDRSCAFLERSPR